MNKKIKNIASVVQTKSAAVLCTLCIVLFLASCTDENLMDNPHAQNALRTVSVNLGMPDAKPAYADGTASRAALDAQPAEILLGDSTLAVSRAEGAEGGSSYYTILPWEDGDGLLVKIDAGTTQGRLMLKYIDADDTEGWFLVKNMSLFKYTGDTYYWYEGAEDLPEGVLPIVEVNESEEDIVAIDISKPITIHIDWNAGVTVPEVSIYYIQNESMTWDDTGKLIYYCGATEAPEMWTLDTDGKWTTSQARLRVHTGVEGDEVKLTSSAFDTASDDEDGEYIAYTDKYGNAYFYGATGDQLTDDFLVELTQMCVPVQTPSGSQTGGETESVSEGRSIILDNYSKKFFTITLDTPITLLEASDVVPVTLAAETAYKLMADVKRTASAKTNLSVIDGQCGITEVRDGFYWGTGDQVAAVKAQIETAVAMGVTDFTVVNQLAIYEINMVNPTCAATVVGEAIRQLVQEAVPPSTEAVDYNGSITLTLADATVVIDVAFFGCTALQSVSAPAATVICRGAFIQCTGLEEVELDVATEIDPFAFFGCTALQSVSAPAVTEIGNNAFNGCTALQTVTLGNVTNIASSAFSGTQVTNLNFDYVTSLGSYALSGLTYANLEMGKEAASYITLQQNAFEGCTLTGSVTFHRVVGKENQVDGLTEGNAFYGVATSELDLFLHAEQPIAQISVSNDGKLMWAGAAWNSITIGDKEYTQETGYVSLTLGTTVYAVIDGSVGGKTEGTPDDVAAVKAQIEAAIARGIYDFTIINQLARDFDTNEAETVVGQATHDLASDESSPNYGKISITIADATELSNGAFYECYALKSVTFNQPVAIRGWVFSFCTALTGMDWAKVTKIGGGAFNRCTFTGPITINQGTELVMEAFEGCTITGTLTIGEGVTVDAAAFHDAIVSDCDLVLPAGQESNVTVSNGMLMWAGAEWKSITVGGVQYKAVGNELYAVIDGTDSYLNLSTYVQKGNLKFYVVNGLSGITKAFTIDGTGASEGSISLVLDEGITDIPSFAFQDCNALGSVVANGVETIEYGAFSGTLAIRELTFKKVISCTSNFAFGQQPQNDYYWTFNCTLTLNESQSGVYGGDDIPSVTWGSCFWGCIKIGVYVYYMRN